MPIQFLGLNIYEPVTVVTNIILAMFCFVWFAKLKKQRRMYWPYFFLFIAVANTLAAFGHGLYTSVNNPVQLGSRVLAMNAFLFAGVDSAMRFSKRSVSFIVIIMSVLLFVSSLIWVIVKNDFTVVKWNGVIILLGLVGGTMAYGYFAKQQRKDALVLSGILVNGLAAVVHTLGISYNEWFNQNDIGHLLMIFGLYLIFKGTEDASPEFQTSHSGVG